MEKRKKAIVYTRVSSKKQLDGVSLEVQQDYCRNYAIHHNLDIVKIFEERGESATTADRTKLKELLLYCVKNAGKIDCLLCYTLDRISRKTLDYWDIYDNLRKLGVEIVAVSQQFDQNTPSGKLSTTLVVAVGQYENENRARKCADGVKKAVVEQGRWAWLAPRGYVNHRVLGKRNICPAEDAKIISGIWDLILDGKSETEARLITNEKLEQAGFKPIKRQAFCNILRNPIYKGQIVVRTFGRYGPIKGSFEPLVDEKTFDKTVAMLDGNWQRQTKRIKHNPKYPLRGILYDQNGHRMYASSSRGNGGVYPKYHCPWCKGQHISYDVPKVNELFLKYVETIELKNDIKEALKVALAANLGDRKRELLAMKEKAKKELENIERKSDVLLEKVISGVVSDEVAKKTFDKYAKRKIELSKQLSELELNEEDPEELLAFGLDKLCDLKKTIVGIENQELRYRFQKWLFPNGIVFDGQELRTNRLPYILQIKKSAKMANFRQSARMVGPAGIEPALYP